ncbi:hypothetical protein AAFC00_002304 [Neodothiora populina]|uniref:SEC7 domain-containing protein n=1 Tax=Neodothiora populina TaxID=2781224 RepID=A0ABR3PGZ6_9PEZI
MADTEPPTPQYAEGQAQAQEKDEHIATSPASNLDMTRGEELLEDVPLDNTADAGVDADADADAEAEADVGVDYTNDATADTTDTADVSGNADAATAIAQPEESTSPSLQSPPNHDDNLATAAAATLASPTNATEVTNAAGEVVVEGEARPELSSKAAPTSSIPQEETKEERNEAATRPSLSTRPTPPFIDTDNIAQSPIDTAPSTDAVGSAGATPGANVSGASPPPTSASTPTAHSRAISQSTRHRTDSQSTTATNATTRSTTRSSMVFVVSALESIAASKDARKNKRLGESTQRALSAIKSQGDPTQTNPEILFEPLQLATEANTVAVVVTALDCIGKLISYSYFSIPVEQAVPGKKQPIPLIERAIDTICDCFQGEATPNEVQMQIIKSLLAAILNDKIVVHGAGLLKSVRQTYNIFLLSKSSANQHIAQGTLTQMVGTVFERVKTRLAQRDARANSSASSFAHGGIPVSTDTPVNGSDTPTEDEAARAEGHDEQEEDVDTTRMTLQTFETKKSFDDARIADNAPTMVTHVKKPRPAPRHASASDTPAITVNPDGLDITEEDEEDEIFIKDAFLVFRAMCKLSTKALRVEEAVDIKSQGMRSKLLSLHIIHNLLYNHPIVFTSPHSTIRNSSNNEPTNFTNAIKQYLCLSLSRNGASSVNRVFEVCAEIFFLMIRNLRILLKKEVEVFLKEIYLTILHKQAAPAFQKQYIIVIFTRLAADPKALVELYLNYDCDRSAIDNMYQRIIEHLSRLASTPVPITSEQEMRYHEYHAKHGNAVSDWQNQSVIPPSLSSATIHSTPESSNQDIPLDFSIKQQALECLVETLRSMVNWSQQGMTLAPLSHNGDSRLSLDDSRESMDVREPGAVAVSPIVGGKEDGGSVTPIAEDDPAELERIKHRKTALNNAIRQFNFKPKRGIKVLLDGNFIASKSPTDIAAFLLSNDRLDKKALGEYLGEGDQENIAIMHAFVDLMDFTKTRFVEALRRFLQSFRLPGEAQKIDRLMLKFAERYVTGNPNAFANADTAYVLAYSVVMLNTDQHSAQVKQRMTAEDFIKNNRGINDGQSLPDEYLTAIFDEISKNEIVLNTERENAANMGMLTQQNTGLAANIGQAVATFGRDLQREAAQQASEEISSRTELQFKSLLKAQRRGAFKLGTKFITATSFRHIGPMFDATWMAFLTALSGQAQETTNLERVRLCMEGIKLAIRISCLFDLPDPRQAFVGSLARFTNLYNFSEMQAKNVEALKALIDVAVHQGDLLRESWRDILTSISQLDRFQLISTGVNEGDVPDVLRSAAAAAPQNRKTQNLQKHRSRQSVSTLNFHTAVAEESRSADIIRGVDRIFTSTAKLSGDAIVHFVRALTQVSWQEIQSSGLSDSPRTYSLQKIVEISGYNMTRVRFEWTRIWQILGNHFIQVGCHNNTNVVYFALNSLRQLSMKFMELEELPGFKFQKDFLKPFEHILNNANQIAVKDMVLRCLIQMIQARGDNIRSGWKTMFGVFTVAAREPYESIVNLAYDNVTQVYNDRFAVVITQGAFADLIVCLTEFSKNHKFQKKSLQAIEALKMSVPKMLRTPECPLSIKSNTAKDAPVAEGLPKQPTRQTQEEQYWFPVLFAFHDVLMTGEDLEVRSRALNYLFDTLTRYGGDFPRDFWDTLWRQLLYPIFMVLKSKSEMSKALNHEELSVWLSTTMIQALRNMISLFTHFFESLEYMLDRFLDLLALCICQENDTLARIGSNCLQQLILQNVTKFTAGHWDRIVGAFIDLFARTEATALFSAATSSSYPRKDSSASSTNGAPVRPNLSESASADPANPENSLPMNGSSPDPEASSIALRSGRPRAGTAATMHSFDSGDLESFAPSPNPSQSTATVPVTAARRRFFNQIITKCVLQLLMIETVSELFSVDSVYSSIPSHELLRLMALLKKSYHFARRFNEDRDLRTRLFREGFMRQPPNLLKQESGSASVYVSILLRMFADTGAERRSSRAETEAALIPLCADIVRAYISLDEETQQRNIVTWRPVVVDVLEGVAGFEEADFRKHTETFAPLAVGLLGTRDLGLELQRAVQGFWARVCEVGLGVKI